MKRDMVMFPVLLAAVAVLILTLGATASAGDVVELDEAEIFFEENATDGDLGIQIFLDGEPWRRVRVISPEGRTIFYVRNGGSVGEIGSTEVFTESAEPGYEDEQERQAFLDLFPEGEYRFLGLTLEGHVLVGTAELTHDLPDAPEILSPEEDEDVDPDKDFSIEWETVDDPDPPDSVIEAYQIVVEKDEDNERLRVYSVDMLSTDTSVTVPSEFFEAGKNYKVEVLAIETSGNKTIKEVPFATE
jgi:hypothetical protein